MQRLHASGVFGFAILLAGSAAAGDWPQILGPHRNGRADGEEIVEKLPAGGPPTLWRREVGEGYAGVAVAEGKTILFHRQGDEEIVEALDPQSGKTLWRKSFPARYVTSIDPDDGPRCTPLIARGRVYLYGADAHLFCLNLADGRQIWSRDLKQDFDARDGYFGAGSSPILIDGKLLVNVGGRDGAGIVAFSADTGETLWKATDEGASYSSPVAATVDGRTVAIFIARLNMLGLDPATGEVLFRFPFGRRGPSVNGANPVVLGDKLFCTASYGTGAALVQLSESGAKLLWRKGDLMSSHYPTPVAHDGYLYGIDGRQDVGVARLCCIDPLAGKPQWSVPDYGVAAFILADEKLVIVTTEGELVLARPSSKKYEELARARLLPGTIRALPALADGRLYVRDQHTLKCVDLRP